MKTIYSFLFVLLISLSSISGQSLTSTQKGIDGSVKVEYNDPFFYIPDLPNEFNLETNVEFRSTSGNQFSTKINA